MRELDAVLLAPIVEIERVVQRRWSLRLRRVDRAPYIAIGTLSRVPCCRRGLRFGRTLATAAGTRSSEGHRLGRGRLVGDHQGEMGGLIDEQARGKPVRTFDVDHERFAVSRFGLSGETVL